VLDSTRSDADADEILRRYGVGALDPGPPPPTEGSAALGLAGLAALAQALETAGSRPARHAALAAYWRDGESLGTAQAAWSVAPARVEAELVRIGAIPGLGRGAERLRRAIVDGAPRPRVVERDEPGPPLGEVLGHSIPAGTRVPAGWVVDRGGVWRLEDRDGSVAAVPVTSRPILATAIVQGDAGQSVHLEWRQRGEAGSRGGTWSSAVVRTSVVQDPRALVAAVADAGAPIGAHSARAVARYVHEQLEASDLPVAVGQARCGWTPGRQAYLWGRVLLTGGDRVAPGRPPSSWAPGHALLEADGEEATIAETLHAAGEWEAWRAAVTTAIEAPPAAIALYAALGAPLLGILAAADNPIIDLSGPTSIGKTTALWLAASVWGRPGDRGGLIASWDLSPTKMERLCAFLCDMPVLIDDTKRLARPEQAEEAVYTLAQGVGRGRARPDGTRLTARWTGSVVSTGEAEILAAGTAGGARARAIQITDLPLGALGEAGVDALRGALREHYGHAGPRAVEWLLRHRARWEWIRERYEARAEGWRTRLPAGGVGSRLARVAAWLECAQILAHDVLRLPRPATDPLSRLPVWIAEGVRDADRATIALRDVYAWCVQHQSEFWGRHIVDPGGPRQPARGWAGAWAGGVGDGPASGWWEEIAIVPGCLDRVLIHLGHAPGEVLRVWQDRGWILVGGEAEARRTQRRPVAGGRPRCVVLARAALEGA
jgi:hypothetical protein